jgi:hypothetical protein
LGGVIKFKQYILAMDKAPRLYLPVVIGRAVQGLLLNVMKRVLEGEVDLVF